MSEPAEILPEALPTQVELDDDELLDWRPRRPLLPVLAAAAGALVIGLGIGAALGLYLGVPMLAASQVEEQVEPVTHVQDLGVLNVNLRGGEGERVLSIRAQVQVKTTDADRVSMLAPALRDGVLVLASDHTAEDLMVGEGRARFRDELKMRLDLLLGDDRVTDLFLTELVVK